MLVRIGKTQQEQWALMDSNATVGIHPPINYLGFAGDGAPFVAACRMKDGDEEGRWDHIVPLLGAFHLFMEAFKKSNDFNEEGIAWLVSTFIGKNGNEATEQNIAYFLDFKDPTDYEKMMGSILHAIYDHAIRSMQENGIEEANPKMVLDFMRKRAKESPLANSILILVWLWEVTLLIRKSERTNSF
jgi:hypothetical protein